jgi:thioredoxin-related protein
MEKIVIILMLVMIILVGLSCQKTEGDTTFVPVTEFDPSRDAAKDLDLAVIEAQRTGKYILLNIGGDWCTWCRKYDEFLNENKDITNFMHQKFVLVKINFSPDNRNKKVLSRFPDITGYPHLFVLDETGKLLHSQDTSELEEGDKHDREKMLRFFKKWAPDVDA